MKKPPAKPLRPKSPLWPWVLVAGLLAGGPPLVAWYLAEQAERVPAPQPVSAALPEPPPSPPPEPLAAAVDPDVPVASPALPPPLPEPREVEVMKVNKPKWPAHPPPHKPTFKPRK